MSNYLKAKTSAVSCFCLLLLQPLDHGPQLRWMNCLRHPLSQTGVKNSLNLDSLELSFWSISVQLCSLDCELLVHFGTLRHGLRSFDELFLLQSMLFSSFFHLITINCIGPQSKRYHSDPWLHFPYFYWIYSYFGFLNSRYFLKQGRFSEGLWWFFLPKLF